MNRSYASAATAKLTPHNLHTIPASGTLPALREMVPETAVIEARSVLCGWLP